VRFDPRRISYDALLTGSEAARPATLNRQGNDVGTQYRSAIFVHPTSSGRAAEASRARGAGELQQPIVTEITPAGRSMAPRATTRTTIARTGRSRTAASSSLPSWTSSACRSDQRAARRAAARPVARRVAAGPRGTSAASSSRASSAHHRVVRLLLYGTAAALVFKTLFFRRWTRWPHLKRVRNVCGGLRRAAAGRRGVRALRRSRRSQGGAGVVARRDGGRHRGHPG